MRRTRAARGKPPSAETPHDIDLGPDARASLAILIREIQEILDGDKGSSAILLSAEIRGLLQTWIDGNNLHPEEVESLSIAELARLVGPTPKRGEGPKARRMPAKAPRTR